MRRKRRGRLEILHLRMRAGRAAGWAAGGTVFGTAGVIVTIITSMGEKVPWQFWAIAGPLIAISGLLLAYVRGHSELIPSTIVQEIDSDTRYTATYCTQQTLKEACDLTLPYYTSEYVSGEVAEQWRLINPKSFVAIHNAHGELCASFGVMALAPTFLTQFIDGKVTDLQLASADILPASMLKKSPSLYLSGVVVDQPDKFIGHRRTRVMVWCILKYLKSVCTLRNPRTLYALAVTKNSERLLKRLGFKVCCNAKARKDGFNFYELEFTQQRWASMLENYEDYSLLCDIQFN